MATLFFSPIVKAQESMDDWASESPSSTPEERAEKQTGWMKDHLALSEDQIPKVYDINVKYARQMQQVRVSGKPRVQKLKMAKSLSQERDKELKNVLTSDQYAQYETKKQETRKYLLERAKDRRRYN